MLPMTNSPTSPIFSTGGSQRKLGKSKTDLQSLLKLVPIFIVVLLLALAYYQQYKMAQYYESVDDSGWPMRIRQGWFFGRKMDLTDSQWNSFRQFFPLLMLACVIYCSISGVLYKLFQSGTSSFSTGTSSSLISNSSNTGNSGLSVVRLAFYIITSIGFIVFLFRFNALYVMLIAVVNYEIGVRLKGSKFGPILTWLFTLVILVSSDYYSGYSRWTLSVLNFISPKLRMWYYSHSGLVNWATYYNITMCRLISYNMDLRETYLKMQRTDTLGDGVLSTTNDKESANWTEYRRRQEELRSMSDYNFVNYFVYIFYVPCYIAGPICSYNAFVSFLYRRQQEVSVVKIVRMSIGVIVYTLILEISLHFGYYVGFNDERCWRTDNSPICAQIMKMNSVQICSTGLLTLAYMFLKFTIIWRFFRVWALWDGQNVPENMTDCVFNHYLVTHFWRNWHRSMYLWIVKYMYVPLGGSRTRLLSAWLIFGFIAIWHDLWWRWVAWAYFNAFLMCVEVLFTHFVAPKLNRWVPLSGYKKKVAVAILGALNGSFLISANLAIMYGFEGTYHFLGSIALWADLHILTIPLVIFAITCALLASFEIKELRGLTPEKEKEKQ